MPDWLGLGFDMLAAGQRASMNEKLEVTARAVAEAERRAQVENAARQVIFEVGQALRPIDALALSHPDAAYVATSLAKIVIASTPTAPSDFSQIADKDRSAEVITQLKGLDERVANGLDAQRRQEADRFVNLAFPLTALIRAERTRQDLEDVKSKMLGLGKGRSRWNMITLLSVVGLFVLPTVMAGGGAMLAALGSANEDLMGLGILGMFGAPCLGMAVPFMGIVVGLIAKGAATPKEWHELNRHKKELTQELPPPQQVAEWRKEAGISGVEDLERAETEFRSYSVRIGFERLPALPLVQNMLNPA